ncbi:Heterokaryon incompatibility [Fusarium oxysporum f. sp. vasinfectum]|nr:Heterokaryon incompatibility [Fusarium oxysporum f. sp. vasinfectum]
MCVIEDLGSRGSSPPPIWTLLDAQPWTDLDDHMGVSRSLRQVEAWLSSCEAGHEYCLPRGSGPGKYFLTRVIDVDRVEDGTVYLRERSEVKTGFLSEGHKAEDLSRGYLAYWTLSHRWGDPELIQQLSQSTENQLRSGMGVSDLSPTFRDACLLVRRMGYEYIWIDSLCIFQDSLSEWQQEAKAMVHSQHLDDERGFGVGPWVFFNDSIWTDDVASTPLSTRGWVVQERFLAPLGLYFTENQIYWECLETTVCESDPSGELQILAKDWHLRPPIQTVYKAAGREIARSLSKVLSGQQYITRDEEKAYLTLWGDVVSIYANCALTNKSDRLLAMSGIAKSFQEANQDTCLAGLWKKIIHSNLTWKTDASDGAKVFRSHSSYAPTWSWASVVGGHTTLSMIAIMKTAAMLTIAAFATGALSLEVKDASTAGGGTPGSPACNRQCLITISPVDGASTQRSDGFPGSCKEYATGQLKGINRSVDGGRLNINGVGGNLVIDFVKNGRDRRASFTNCKEAVFTGAQCSLKQGGCDKQAESG